MIEKIKPLLEIQKLDIQISEIEYSYKKLPEKISDIIQIIKIEDLKIENLNLVVSELELASKGYEKNVLEIEEKVKLIEEKLFSINSTKEFEALQKETGDLKRKKIEIEDSLIKVMEEIETKKEDSKKTQENFESEILPMKGQIEELELELDESKTEVESLSNQRLDLAKNADKDFLKIYERLSLIHI